MYLPVPGGIDGRIFTPAIAIARIAVLMGMVLESIGILLLVQVFLPTLIQSGVDMIWFGIIVVVVVVKLGLMTFLSA